MNYREFVEKTCSASGRDLVNVGLGLCGEAGEVADLIKKALYKDRPVDKNKLLLELGDVVWYTELACILLGTSVEELQALNMQKLRARYSIQEGI